MPKLRNLFIKKILFVIFTSFLTVSVSNAQSFEIVEKTSNYSAGDSVEFYVSGTGIDFDKSDISWNIGNKNITSGFGEKNITLRIPKEESILSAIITTVKGEKYTNSFRVYTKDVILHWEATDSYVPSWYAAKKMLVKGGTARVYAYPNITNKGEKIKDADMYFSWEISGVLSKNSGGYGRNYLDVTALEISEDNIEVSVSIKPRLSDEEVENSIVVPITNTEVMIYPKIGSNKTALFGTNKFETSDFILSAEPYFFSLDKKYSFSWTVGNRTEKGFSEKGFRASKAGIFTNIKVKVEHVKKIFQEAESELTVTF